MLTVRLAVCAGRNRVFLSVLNVKRGRRGTYLCIVFCKTRGRGDTERKTNSPYYYSHTLKKKEKAMIKYIAQIRKNPVTKAVAWYPQAAHVEALNLDDIAERISLTCTVTEHDIKAVLSALQEQIVFALRNGNSVRLGDLGSFRLTMQGNPSETREEVSAEKIKRIRVRFTSGSRLRTSLKSGARGVRFGRTDEKAAGETDSKE